MNTGYVNYQLFGHTFVIMTEENDLMLVSQCLEGDAKAFDLLVTKYQKIMFNVALRMINNYEDAEDVTQSAFVKAFEKLDTFDPDYRFFSWLYRITINESLNFLNQRKQFTELDKSLISNEKTPEQRYQESETSRNVQVALMDLKLEYRTVIILKHLQDFSYREIGDILQLPEKTVKSRLFTARQLLKSILIDNRIGRND